MIAADAAGALPLGGSDDPCVAASSWARGLWSVAVAGGAAILCAVGGVSIGAIVAAWSVQNIEVARLHPAPVFVVVTSIVLVLFFRAIPWARLRQGSGVGSSTADDAAHVASERPVTRRERLVVGVGSVLCTLLVHWSSLGRLSNGATGITGDRDWYVYVGWKTAQLLKSGRVPLSFQSIAAPYGYDALVGDGFMPPLVLGFVNLVLPPYLSFQVMLMVSTVLAYLAGYWLARLFSSSSATCTLVAMAVASSPAIYFRFLGHLSMTFHFAVVLTLIEAVRLVRTGRLRTYRTALWLIFAFGATAYFFVVAAGVVIIAVLVVMHRDGISRRLVASVAISFGIVVVFMAPFTLARLRFAAEETAAGSNASSNLVFETQAYNSDVLAVMLPTYPTWPKIPGSDHLIRNIQGYSGEGNYAFPGAVLLIFGVGGLVTSRRREARLALVALTTLWLMSVGPVADVYGLSTSQPVGDVPPTEWLPFRVARSLPLLSGLRAPGRMSLMFPAFLAVGLAISLWTVIDRIPMPARWRAVLIGVTGVMILSTNVARFPVDPPAIATEVGRDAMSDLGRLPGPQGRVMPVPACAGTPGIEAATQIWHGLDMVGCQGPYLGMKFASGMPLYRESVDFMGLTCVPSSFIYVPAPAGQADLPVSADLSGLRGELGVRLLLIDDQQLAICASPSAADTVAAAAARYLDWRIDDRFWVIDLNTPDLS